MTIASPTVFPGGVGNTQQGPQRFASLIDDVDQRICAVLPDRGRAPAPG